MARPAVGSAVRRCAGCGGYEYGGAPQCARCRDLVDAIIAEEWAAFLRGWDVGDGDEITLARMVTDEPDRYDWRVVDAAYDRLTCGECGERLSRGPVGCSACDLANGFRYAAIETDRPGAMPGNEHALRVNVSVVRRPHWTSPDELLARRLLLPALLVGLVPSTEAAQRASALIKHSSPAQKLAVLERAVEELLGTRHHDDS